MSILPAACVLAALHVAAAPAAEPHPTVIQNEAVRVAVDAFGCLAELTNRRTGWNYAGRDRLWRVFYTEGDVRDVEAVAPTARAPKITADASSIAVRYDGLESADNKRLQIALELRASIPPGSDEVHWKIVVDNRQPGVTVTEVQFPLVGNCQLRPGQALISSRLGGQRYADPKALVRGSHSRYMALDQNGIKWGIMYPGVHAATNCFVFDAKSEGLYFGSHDPSLQSTLHLLRLVDEQLQAGFVKYPFLATGRKCASAEFVLSPYSGTWHVASKKYRTWANTWFHPPQTPDWVRRMTGWQRVILKHQYGEVLHPYNTIVQMAADGRSAGVDSLLLVAMTQSRQADAQALVEVPGYRLVSTDGLGRYEATPLGGGLRVTLKRHAVALAIFGKE